MPRKGRCLPRFAPPPWPNPLWAPSWPKRTYVKPAGVPIASMRPERGRHSENREALYCTLSESISDTQDEDLTQRRKHDRCHTSCRVSWRRVEKESGPSTYLRKIEKEKHHRMETTNT